jgi:hypothetical protein
MVPDDTSGSDAAGETREQGVDFGRLADELETREYPATREELLAEYGDYELEMAGGSETLRDVLGPQEESGDEERRYESAEAVRQAVYNMVGSEAVGREDYSDRGGSLADEVSEGEDGTDESL